jgi:hypothetical protein
LASSSSWWKKWPASMVRKRDKKGKGERSKRVEDG